MRPDEPNERSETTPAADLAGDAVGPGKAPGGAAPGAWLWLWALAAGLVAGLAAGIGGEATQGLFKIHYQRPANWAQLSPFERPDVESALIRKATPPVEEKNTAVVYGLLGGALGGALGLAGGLARRSARAALAAAVLGLVAGAATGAAAGSGMAFVFYQQLDSAPKAPSGFVEADPRPSLLFDLLVHAAIWAPVGAVAGLAFGAGLGGRRSVGQALFGGLAGAVLGTMAFEVASTLAFPLLRVDSPIPGERLPRLLAVFSVAVFTALGAAVGVQERRRKAA
jgi:hypothetical protein